MTRLFSFIISWLWRSKSSPTASHSDCQGQDPEEDEHCFSNDIDAFDDDFDGYITVYQTIPSPTLLTPPPFHCYNTRSSNTASLDVTSRKPLAVREQDQQNSQRNVRRAALNLRREFTLYSSSTPSTIGH